MLLYRSATSNLPYRATVAITGAVPPAAIKHANEAVRKAQAVERNSRARTVLENIARETGSNSTVCA